MMLSDTYLIVVLILFCSLVIAEIMQVHLWVRFILIGIMSLPIFFMIRHEVVFRAISSEHHSVIVAIKKKLADDDIQGLSAAFHGWQYDYKDRTSVERLRQALQENP